jgi:NADPH:quinone reductase-like Zn-dependent oxidoreductase
MGFIIRTGAPHTSPQDDNVPDNTALWLPSKRAALKIGAAPHTPPQTGEIVVRARAVAINPVDRLMLTIGDIIMPWTNYPFVLGSDVAGEVAAVGPGVTRFRPGDRVLGHAVGSDKQRNSAAEGAFQTYVVLLAHMASPLPVDLSFEAACVLPLGLSTAACGLFQKDFLALNPPSAAPTPSGETVLIWGGSTSVGSNAIQLAVAAGYDVVTTASAHNFDYVKRLGASLAFDYNSKTVVADIVKALQGRRLAGALAIGLGSGSACIDIVGACKGVRFVALASPPTSFDDVPTGRGRIWRLLPAVGRMVVGNLQLAAKTAANGVRTKFIWGSSLLGNEVGPMIYETFLPAALAKGRFITAPDPLLVGHGLEAIPKAIERQRQGVSARKLVVTL